MEKKATCSNCENELSHTKRSFFFGKKEKCSNCNWVSTSYTALKYEIPLFIAVAGSVATIVIGIKQTAILHISLGFLASIAFALLWYKLSVVKAKNLSN